MARPLRLLAVIAVGFAVAALPARADQQSLLALQHYDQRITAIGYRLAASAGDLCARKAPLTGLAFHDLSQYSAADERDARAAFGFAGDPEVLAVAPDSPGAAAGVAVGDAIVAIDGAPPPAVEDKPHDSFARIAALLDQIDRAGADGALDLTIRRSGATRLLHLRPVMGCASRFQSRVSAGIGSRANGSYVEVDTGTVDFADGDAELAAVIAHELSHNILRHRERLDALGIRRGLLGTVGRSARLVRETEIEADRLAPYLLDRAGYPPGAYSTFLRRMGDVHLFGFLRAPTHPSESERIRLVDAEIARIAAMKAAGTSPRPDFMMGATLPRLH